MCQEFINNRGLLIGLIYSHGIFTEEQIAREYRERRHSLMVDGLLSVRGFLNRMHEVGALEYNRGRYEVTG